MQLSVIVPVYNVEKYIFSCIESIFKQRLDDSDFEVIIVNDGTNDRSMEIIKDFIQQHDNITVINQENQGLSVARNTGLKYAGGEYILFVDSDDLLIDNTLKLLLDCAVNSSADMVMGDFLKLTDKQIEKYIPSLSAKESVEMSGEEAFIQFLNPRECYVWRSLYRREFLNDNHISFIPGVYFEDVPFTTECYTKADRCISLPIPFYVYRQRPNSIVSSVNVKKLKDFNAVIEYLWQLKGCHSLTNGESRKLDDTIFTTFSIEMWYLTTDRGLYDCRREIVEDLKKRVPDLFFPNGIKQQLVSLLFRYMPYAYLRLRSKV